MDKYTWVDIGSSYSPSEIIAAFLWAQLENFDSIMLQRMALWNQFHEAFRLAEEKNDLRRPCVPPQCQINAHMYYILLPSSQKRTLFLEYLNRNEINTVFHYVPLHDSPAGKRYGRADGPLPLTSEASERIARLPLWLGMEDQQERIIRKVLQFA